MLTKELSADSQPVLAEDEPHQPYFVPGSLSPAQFASLRNTLILGSCKWDPQVEDISTLAGFPLVLCKGHWQKLSQWAEQLSHETFAAEREILRNPQLLKTLGMPRKLRAVLSRADHCMASPAAIRVLRFDFHFTPEGWKLSEVNSDVPGGFCESSLYPQLMAHHFAQWQPAKDPAALWAQAVSQASGMGTIALLSAPGFMEDHQVTAYLASCLRKLGCQAHLANPTQIQWQDRRARLKTTWSQAPVDALVRFFQAEWMPTLLRGCKWNEYFVGGLTPIANPGSAAISESKRLPLVWNELACPMSTWRDLLPETRDPREVDWRNDDEWILKSAYSNNGDTVCIREFMATREWKKLQRHFWFSSGRWLAQRRFRPVPIETPLGSVYPCIGVFTLNSKVAGIYGRLALRPWIDFAAVDVAVLVERETA
jgi:glutathionylspermidine synthase